MQIKTLGPICVSLMFSAVLANAAPVLTTGTPANSLLSTPTPASPSLGELFNFDSLTPNTNFNSNTYAAKGLTITSPYTLLVDPYSTQTFPNELYDEGPNGTANVTIGLSTGTNKIGIGLADSDPVMVTLQPLAMNGTALGSSFTVNVNAGSTVNLGNGYYVISDSSSDIYGLQVLQNNASANYSGLAIDDVQLTPEPASLVLLALGLASFFIVRFRNRFFAN